MKYVCQQEKVMEYEMEINLFNDEINYPANKQQCKGLFWKRPVSTFLSSLRSIESRTSLRLLKRESCPGWEQCEWVRGSPTEDLDCLMIYAKA
jgi:hypothetical protein